MVKVRDLLTQEKIFQQRRPALARLERVLIVIDAQALISREVCFRAIPHEMLPSRLS